MSQRAAGDIAGVSESTVIVDPSDRRRNMVLRDLCVRGDAGPSRPEFVDQGARTAGVGQRIHPVVGVRDHRNVRAGVENTG